MPVDTPSKEYAGSVDRWTRCRDVSGGSDAVKSKGTDYLPKLSTRQKAEAYRAYKARALFYNATGRTLQGLAGELSTRQKAEAYRAYKARALFYNATGRTLQGLAGAIFARPPQAQAPPAIELQLRDVTLSGTPMEAFALDCLNEVLMVGRCGVLVDMPEDAGDPTSPARPYWVPYCAEQIVSWRTQQLGGDTKLTRVVLMETVEEEDPADAFATKSVTQYRVLELTLGDNGPAIYTSTIWRKKEGANGASSTWEPGATAIPTRRGAPLNFIPFQFIGPTSTLPTVARPPMLDLVDVNLSHYRTSADLEHGRHFVALPQPVISGVSPTDGPFEIGAGSAWTFEDEHAKAYMLEFTGQGLGALEKALEHKEQLMAILGARLLEGQTTKQEAAETVRLRHSGDSVTLKTMAGTVGLALTIVLRTHAWWFGVSEDLDNEEISIGLNTDFVAARASAEDIKAWTLAMQAGGMSWDTFYFNLTRGDIAEPGIDPETEKQRIADSEEMLGLNEPPPGTGDAFGGAE